MAKVEKSAEEETAGFGLGVLAGVIVTSVIDYVLYVIVFA